MVDKAKQRLRALAAEQGISRRAAGNVMAEKRPPPRRGYGGRPPSAESDRQYFSFGDSVSGTGGTPLGDSVSGTGGTPLGDSVSGTGGAPLMSSPIKYLHVDHGTPYGTVWRLSDDADGALMRIPVSSGDMTPRVAEAAFANAVFPMIIETSDDEGKTWVHHPDESPKRDWSGARSLLYTLLGTGRWNAGRICATTGEELVRHPPKLLKDIADAVRAAHPGAHVTLRPPMDQLIVDLRSRRTFAAAPSMRTPLRWPVYVTPVPPPRPEDGSWECKTVEEVLATLHWPEVQPSVRIASLAEIRAK